MKISSRKQTECSDTYRACDVLGSASAWSRPLWIFLNSFLKGRRPPNCKQTQVGTGSQRLLTAHQRVDFPRSEEETAAAESGPLHVHSVEQQWDGTRWAAELPSQEIQLESRAGLLSLYYGEANKVLLLAAIKSKTAAVCWPRQRRSDMPSILFWPAGAEL